MWTNTPLRFIERDGKKILQYRSDYQELNSNLDLVRLVSEWVDVPLVEDGEDGNG